MTEQPDDERTRALRAEAERLAADPTDRAALAGVQQDVDAVAAMWPSDPPPANPGLTDDEWAVLLADDGRPGGRRADPVAMASFLLARLGEQLSSYIVAEDDPAVVARWASSDAAPTDQQAARLTYAALAAKLVADDAGWTNCRSWLMGQNPTLDGEAPGWVLRHSDNHQAYERVVAAAKHWVGGGYS